MRKLHIAALILGGLAVSAGTCAQRVSIIAPGAACAKAEADWLLSIATGKSFAFIERERRNMIEACGPGYQSDPEAVRAAEAGIVPSIPVE